MGKVKMFCLPYAGGGANIYYDWKNKFGSDVVVIPLEYKGHGSLFNEKFYLNMDEAIVDICSRIIKEIEDDYIIYGYSLGSIIALETVYKIVELKKKLPKKLILVGSRPPHLLYKNEKYSHLSQDEFMKKIFELGNTPDEVLMNKELQEIFYEILLNDINIIEHYSYNGDFGKLNVDIHVFSGNKDYEAPKQDMMEWRKYTNGNFKLHTFNGNHFFAFDENEEHMSMIKMLSK